MADAGLVADWPAVVAAIVERGWARLERAAAPAFAAALEAEAPDSWASLPTSEGTGFVRQGGLACHAEVTPSSRAVLHLADAIRLGIDGAGSGLGLPPLPAFNHAEWCRAEAGAKFITPHRDPVTAGGVVAVLTIRGCCEFRVWGDEFAGTSAQAEQQPELATSWDTLDGDLVLLRGGWPTPSSVCPIHEALSPPAGERITLTLRHNVGGYGADYFA